jgi:hypothetical protein
LDIDCGKGYECNVTKSCSPVYSKVNNQTGQNVQSGCQEDWTCTDWSECKSNIQTRECVDKNVCGTTKSVPIEVEGCEPGPISILTGLFLLATSLQGFLFFIISVFLILLFLWRRKKKQA